MIEWISCKDRYPIPQQNLLFLMKNEKIHYGWYSTQSEEWYCRINETKYLSGYVTHWAEVNFPKKPLTIHEAIDAFKEGKKIRRKAWSARDFMQKDNYFNSLSINSIDIYDMQLDDWEIVE